EARSRHWPSLRSRAPSRRPPRRGSPDRRRFRASGRRHRGRRARFGAAMSWLVENYDVLAMALAETVLLVGTALSISLGIAFPLGILAARWPAFYVVAMAATGVLYTVPALALFA